MPHPTETVQAHESRPPVSTTDDLVTHPAWCSSEHCWAYSASEDEPEPGQEPAAGGHHQTAEIMVDTLNRDQLRLELVLDHGDPDALPELQLTFSDRSGGTTRHLNLSHAAELYQALRALVPSLVNDNGAARLYEMGRRYERRAAVNSAVEAFRVGDTIGHQRASQDVVDSLARIQKRLDDAEKERRRAYCNGYVDAMSGRTPEFGVSQ